MGFILVVDDEPVIRESLCFLLTTRRYEVETAATPWEAIEIVKSRMPALLIVDWMLGDDKDGLQLVEILRKLCPTLPVIFVTGYLSEALQARIDSMPHTFVFSKPCPHVEFMRAVEEAIRTEHQEGGPDG